MLAMYTTDENNLKYMFFAEFVCPLVFKFKRKEFLIFVIKTFLSNSSTLAWLYIEFRVLFWKTLKDKLFVAYKNAQLIK